MPVFSSNLLPIHATKKMLIKNYFLVVSCAWEINYKNNTFLLISYVAWRDCSAQKATIYSKTTFLLKMTK